MNRQGPVLIYKLVGELVEPRQPWQLYNIVKVVKVSLSSISLGGNSQDYVHEATAGACRIYGHMYYR